MDVFAAAPLTGAPLTLVPDADDLSDAQMRAIADRCGASAGTDPRPRRRRPFGPEHRPGTITVTVAGSRVLVSGSGLVVATGTMRLP